MIPGRLAFFLRAMCLVSLVQAAYWSEAGSAGTSRPAEGRSGMVASAHGLASQAGVDILKKGGNAVDAAVAAAFVLGVVEPHASGIGGGGFMLVYLAKTKEVVAIDYRETAPAGARQDRLTADQARVGARAVNVPGMVAGLTTALDRYGTLDLKTILEPSIRFAEEGFVVNGLLHTMMANQAAKLRTFPEAAGTYLKGGRPYVAGERLRQDRLGRTYRMIAEQGAQVFYRGDIAAAIDKEMKRRSGWLSREDLAAYRPIIRQPVKGSYRGYEVFSMPPPSCGVLVIELLHILEGYDIGSRRHNGADNIQLMAEAMRRVFMDKARFIGDPDFVRLPLEDMLSEGYAADIRKGIQAGQVNRKVGMPKVQDYESDQTTHVSVADKEGNLVSLTHTLNGFFGSGIVVTGTGILLNNEMSDFGGGKPNRMKPGKRPASNMSPCILLKDGEPYMALGMAGATRIVSGIPQILINMIDYGMDIQRAIEAPRIYCATTRITMESRIPTGIRRRLTQMGYTLDVRKSFDLYLGGAQGVMIDRKAGRLYGGADPRRSARVVGY